jgi:4-amino-4-deoxy-L-arabinose transferase-like glycosyltransferase
VEQASKRPGATQSDKIMPDQLRRARQTEAAPTPYGRYWELKLLFWILPVIFAVLFPLAFVRGTIWADEGWIGQHVLSILTRGYVVSDFFRDLPPLDGPILIYHKLLVWIGVAVTYVAGWGLYQLRAIPAVCGMLTLLVLYFGLPEFSKRVRLMAVMILLFTPLYWGQMVIFRPEPLMLLCGVTSFALLRRFIGTSRLQLAFAAGAFAGLAGLSHPVGLAFAVAGLAGLLVERRYKALLPFAIAAIVCFAPYLSGLFTDPELFKRQLFQNPGMTTSHLTSAWWQPFINLIDDHKRLFRTPEVIGLSVLTVIALHFTNRQMWRRNLFFVLYVVSLLLVTGMSPLDKMMTRYVIPMAPFFALTSAKLLTEPPGFSSGFQRILRPGFYLWTVAFFVYGAVALSRGGLFSSDNQLADNRAMKARISDGALVMAPFDFVFPLVDSFTVQSWWGCEKNSGGQLTPEFADRYADSLQVGYLVLDAEYMKRLKLAPGELQSRFAHYDPEMLLERDQRYLLERKVAAPIDK